MSRIKAAISRAGRNRAFPRRLPDSLGGAKFYASTEGGLKYLRRDMNVVDPILTQFAQDYVKPGHTVWDIGTNVGLFTFTAAGLAGTRGRVVSLEPDMWLVSLLRRSARANCGGARVDILPAAVSDTVGVAEFLIAADNRATNALEGHGHAVTMGGIRERQYVPTVTLDSLIDTFSAPDIVKIDVEGAELLALAGAQRLLFDVRPTWMIEVEKSCRPAVTAVLLEAGYKIIDGASGTPVDSACWSTIASPI